MVIGKMAACYEVLQTACLENDAEDEKYYLEKIYVKAYKQEAIRCAWAKKNSHGHYQILKHPLELSEDDVFTLLGEGINQKVISPVLRAGLKTVLRRTHPPPMPIRAIYVGGYSDLYARGVILEDNLHGCMEKIFVKGLNTYKIRFAFYRPNENNHWEMVLQPMVLNEVQYLDLFERAVEKGVFSKVFLAALLSVL